MRQVAVVQGRERTTGSGKVLQRASGPPLRTVSSGGAHYRRIDPCPRSLWDEIASADRTTLLSSTPAWVDAMTDTHLFRDLTRGYEAPDGRLFVVPLVWHRARRARASMAHGWGNGGILTAGPLTAHDVRVITDDLRADGPVSIRPSPLHAKAWDEALLGRARGTTRVAHVVDLRDGFDHVWQKGFAKQSRHKVRQAEKSPSVTVEVDSTGAQLDVFYDMYLQWITARTNSLRLPGFSRRWAARARDPLTKLRAVARRTGDRCRLYIGRLDGQPIEAGFLLLHGAQASFWRVANVRSATDRSYVHYLIPKLMMEDASREGCEWFHFGESGGIESLMEFKRRIGGQPVQGREWFLSPSAQPVALGSPRVP